ncbi:molybdenum cofactor biosynthesis protein MoaE [Hyphococcus lacteus]|uniref:Molybdopterin synthase catalytic subunit n=1 Tax=Hyphococcus lacteus TaxID=3143536 RepID=A0ABV3Z668_9PROT
MIEIAKEPFDPADKLSIFQNGSSDDGAIVSFVGKVRGQAEHEAVTTLKLEHFPGMTERSIQEFMKTVFERWSINRVSIVHRVGDLSPGEPIVMVCVSAAHRRQAFEAADFLMDFLKTKAMFWKKEIRSGSEAWIEPRTEDYDDVKRWDKG